MDRSLTASTSFLQMETLILPVSSVRSKEATGILSWWIVVTSLIVGFVSIVPSTLKGSFPSFISAVFVSGLETGGDLRCGGFSVRIWICVLLYQNVLGNF